MNPARVRVIQRKHVNRPAGPTLTGNFTLSACQPARSRAVLHARHVLPCTPETLAPDAD